MWKNMEPIDKRDLWIRMNKLFDRWDWQDDEREAFIAVAKTDLAGVKAVIDFDEAHPEIWKRYQP